GLAGDVWLGGGGHCDGGLSLLPILTCRGCNHVGYGLRRQRYRLGITRCKWAGCTERMEALAGCGFVLYAHMEVEDEQREDAEEHGEQSEWRAIWAFFRHREANEDDGDDEGSVTEDQLVLARGDEGEDENKNIGEDHDGEEIVVEGGYIFEGDEVAGGVVGVDDEEGDVVGGHDEEQDGEADGDNLLLEDESLPTLGRFPSAAWTYLAERDVLEDGDQKKHQEGGTHIDEEGHRLLGEALSGDESVGTGDVFEDIADEDEGDDLKLIGDGARGRCGECGNER